jgi:hypothetical protein
MSNSQGLYPDLTPTTRTPERRAGEMTTTELLEKLDCRVAPGITVAQFLKVFVLCRCGLVTTARVFREHKCMIEIIDLTRED